MFLSLFLPLTIGSMMRINRVSFKLMSPAMIPKYQGVETVDVDVTVQDDSDTAGVLLSTATVTVSEPATTADILVTLNSEPLAPVTIHMTSQDNTECAATSSVTLSADNWQSGETMTITAVDDNNIDDSQLCTVTTTASSSDATYDGIVVVDPIVTVQDNDYADIIVGTPNVVVSEPNATTIMVLKLTSIPTAPVTVALESTDPTECDVTNSVVLSNNNWDTGVGATIFAANDDIDDGDRACPIKATITSADGHYNGLSVNNFPTTVLDDDTAGTIVSKTTLAISEPDGDATFTVALTSEPTSTVTINLVSEDTTECSVPMTTTLNATNWQAGVPVIVTAVNDDVDDEVQLCTVGTATSSSDTNYNGIAIDDVMVSVADDDTAGVVIAPTALTIGEPAITDTFTILLTSEPTQLVTVNLSSSDLGECTVPATVTLDANNWKQGIVVPVQAVDDRIDDADQLCNVATIVTSADSDYAGITADDIAVTVQDDTDTAGILVSSTVLTVTEPAASAQFTVTLASEPVESVTINMTPDDGSECMVPASISLDAGNWEQGLTVTVSAVDDDIDDSKQFCVVQTNAVSADGLYNNRTVADVQTVVLDEDTAGMLLSTTALTITEPNGTLAYTISLTSEPVAPVDVMLQSSDTTECAVTTTVTLDAGNWRGLAVPVNTVDDNVMDGPQPCTIQHTVTSNDPLYNGTVLEDLAATVLDEDIAGIVVTPQTLSIGEMGESALFTVALTSEPIAEISVDLISLDTTECTVPARVTITPQDWRTGHALMVTAVDDFKVDGDQFCAIETSTVSSQDSNYQDMAVNDVMATIVDDDRIEVRFDPATPVVSEPDTSTTVMVRLGSEPTADVDLTFTSNDIDECLVDNTATLTPANWRDGVAITLTAVDDAVDDGEQICTINTTTISGDSDYDGLAIAGLSATVEDNEAVTMMATVLASTDTAEIGETIIYTYQVLNTGDVPLTVSAIDNPLGTVTFDQGTVAPQALIQGRLTRVTQENDLPGPLVSTSSFTAESAMGSVITATQTTTVAVAAHPQLLLNVVRLGPPHVSPGTEVTYQVVITNTGHIPARITSIQGEATTPTQSVDAQEIIEVRGDVMGASLQAECTAPITLNPSAVHQCTMSWQAVKGESDAVEFTVWVESQGLADFTATDSASDIVIISGPTSSGSLRIYLPVVSR